MASDRQNEFARLDLKTHGDIAISVSTILDRFTRRRLQQALCGPTNLMPEPACHGARPALTRNEGGVIGQAILVYGVVQYKFPRVVLPVRRRRSDAGPPK